MNMYFTVEVQKSTFAALNHDTEHIDTFEIQKCMTLVDIRKQISVL